MIDLAVKAWEAITTVVINRFMKADHNIDGTHRPGLDASNFANFSAAVDKCGPNGSEPCTLFITKAVLATANKTIPDHVTLIRRNRGKLIISSGITITHNGSIVSTPDLFFDGSGTIDLTGNKKVGFVYAEWWGADPSNAIDDSAALTAAIASIIDVHLLAGTYKSTTGDTLNTGQKLLGLGIGITTYNSTFGGAAITQTGSYSSVESLTIDCNDTASSIGLYYNGSKNCYHANIRVVNAITEIKVYGTNADNCFENTSYGITELSSGILAFEFDGATNGDVYNNHFGPTYIDAVTTGVSVGTNFRVDNNGFTFLKVDTASGWGIDLVKQDGFVVNDGYLVSNSSGDIQIANYDGTDNPGSIYINTYIDGGLAGISYTRSAARAIKIKTQDAVYNLGLDYNPQVWKQKDLTYSASITPDLEDGNYFTITATDGVALDVNAIANVDQGAKALFRITNGAGGAMGVITWNAIFVTTWSGDEPANTKIRTIEFVYDSTDVKWYQVSLAPADLG